MDYAEAIKQDVQAILLTDNVEVTVLEHSQDSTVDKENIRFGILVGKGKKGGLLFIADINKLDLTTAMENCITMIRSQLVLYAIACLEKAHKAKLGDIFIPHITHTVLFKNNEAAQSSVLANGTIVGAFNIFEGTYFNEDKMAIDAKIKPIKKVTKKTNAK